MNMMFAIIWLIVILISIIEGFKKAYNDNGIECAFAATMLQLMFWAGATFIVKLFV